MADIVERLRSLSPVTNAETRETMQEAAVEIERLRAALEDIAYGNPLHNENDLMRIARAALEGK